MTAEDRRRIDKWLWYARLAKTRTTAQALAVSGRVRVNSEKNQSASRGLKIGDVLTVALELWGEGLACHPPRRTPRASVGGAAPL